ncbi:MAG TPA: hypothetical protein PLF40_33390 [Kofleriaceae bacterium]|nr:hypothetical protein [Kofleriaceae bacterium]
MKLANSIAPLLLATALSACAGVPKAGETLMESVQTYNEGVRWERFAAAASRLPAAERMAFIDESDARSKDFKLTDYEVVRVAAVSDKVAKVQVRLSWYRESEGTLRETHAVQTWKRSGKVWVLASQARLRGPEMPGVMEPVEPATVEMDPVVPQHSAL